MNLPSDGDIDQEPLNSIERESVNHLLLLSQNDEDDRQDNLPVIKIQTNINSREEEGEVIDETEIPDPEPEQEQEQLIFDSESQSDDNDGNQEQQNLEAEMEMEEELANEIPWEYYSVMNFMGAFRGPKFLGEKRLTRRDVDERRNRFLIPERKLWRNFLTVKEEEDLNREKWRPVEIIEPDCTVSLVTLSKWTTVKGVAYVFITEWSGLVERNELQEGDFVQLWSFRAAGDDNPGRLCFLLLDICDE